MTSLDKRNQHKGDPYVLRTSALAVAASVAVPDPAVAAHPAHLHGVGRH